MSAIKHSWLSLCFVATNPFAKSFTDHVLYADALAAQEVCAQKNAAFRSENGEGCPDPYHVYAFNGVMTPHKELAAVEGAIEQLRKLHGLHESLKVSDLFAAETPQYQALRQHLCKIEEFRLPLRKSDTLGELCQFLVEIKNPLYKLERLEAEAAQAKAAMLANIIRPYPPGSIIEYADMLGELIEDNDSSVLVLCEGEKVQWRWNFDGEECKLVDLPDVLHT
jgi:hypothetical protein